MVVASIWNAFNGKKLCDIKGRRIIYMQKEELIPVADMLWYHDWLVIGDVFGEIRIYSMVNTHKPKLIYINSLVDAGYLSKISISSRGLLAFNRGEIIKVLRINDK